MRCWGKYYIDSLDKWCLYKLAVNLRQVQKFASPGLHLNGSARRIGWCVARKKPAPSWTGLEPRCSPKTTWSWSETKRNEAKRSTLQGRTASRNSLIWNSQSFALKDRRQVKIEKWIPINLLFRAIYLPPQIQVFCFDNGKQTPGLSIPGWSLMAEPDSYGKSWSTSFWRCEKWWEFSVITEWNQVYGNLFSIISSYPFKMSSILQQNLNLPQERRPLEESPPARPLWPKLLRTIRLSNLVENSFQWVMWENSITIHQEYRIDSLSMFLDFLQDLAFLKNNITKSWDLLSRCWPARRALRHSSQGRKNMGLAVKPHHSSGWIPRFSAHIQPLEAFGCFFLLLVALFGRANFGHDFFVSRKRTATFCLSATFGRKSAQHFKGYNPSTAAAHKAHRSVWASAQPFRCYPQKLDGFFYIFLKKNEKIRQRHRFVIAYNLTIYSHCMSLL